MVWNNQLRRDIPSDWNVMKLEDCISECGQATKPGDHLRELPYCPIDEIPIRTMSFCGGKPYSEANSSLQLYCEDNILIGAMRVYFHRCCIASENGITRTTTLVLKPIIDSFLAFFYGVLDEERAFSYAIKVSTGTQQPYVTWNAFSKYKFPFPKNTDIIKRYCAQIMPIIQKVKSNAKETERLIKQRDELLPLLMNGQVNSDLFTVLV